jgi:hypothetical protein
MYREKFKQISLAQIEQIKPLNHPEVESTPNMNETQAEINIRLYNVVYHLYETRSS